MVSDSTVVLRPSVHTRPLHYAWYLKSTDHVISGAITGAIAVAKLHTL